LKPTPHPGRTTATPDPAQADRLLDTALRAARAAAAVHATERGRLDVSEWSSKGAAADFVTRVDRESEEAALAVIRTAFPDHDILAEEGAPDAEAAGLGVGWTWVVDPLDGTTNYLHGFPAYAASVAVAHEGQPVAGAVVAANGDEFTARAGGGAFRNGEAIRASRIERMEHALIGTGYPFKNPEHLPAYQRQFAAVLKASSGIRRAGAAALDLCWVACGWFDGFWELQLAPWDVAAGGLIAREAGAVVTLLDGRDDILAGGAYLAGNPSIHEQLGRLVRENG